MRDSRTLNQLIRFAIVGVVSNGLLYAAYIAFTAAGMGPKLAMTVLYLAGTLQGFLFNKHWSFGSARSHGPELIRYILAYAIGYLVNLAALVAFVDVLGLPHRAVQGVLIVALALLLFALQKFWVFRSTNSPNFGNTA